MADKIGDFLVRLDVYSEADPLDFRNTHRGVFIVEDGVAELPLPKGDKGEQGDKGDPGPPLRPDLVLDETTDGKALTKLQERSGAWRRNGMVKKGFFALNKQTKTGFFYSRGGWVTIPDIFSGAAELSPAEYNLPVKFTNVTVEPATPTDGIILYAQNNQLKMKTPSGTVKVLG